MEGYDIYAIFFDGPYSAKNYKLTPHAANAELLAYARALDGAGERTNVVPLVDTGKAFSLIAVSHAESAADELKYWRLLHVATSKLTHDWGCTGDLLRAAEAFTGDSEILCDPNVAEEILGDALKRGPLLPRRQVDDYVWKGVFCE